MRLREAILADLPRLSREAKELDRIKIQDGTKGGRNLIASYESYPNLLQEIVRAARNILHMHNLKGFHKLRAVYACERYEQIIQDRAPINGGQCCQVDRKLDREARRQIRYGLGHGRTDVVSAYIEGRA